MPWQFVNGQWRWLNKPKPEVHSQATAPWMRAIATMMGGNFEQGLMALQESYNNRGGQSTGSGGQAGSGGASSAGGGGVEDADYGPNVRDPFFGPAARAYEGQSFQDIRNNSRAIQAGRDLSRSGYAIPSIWPQNVDPDTKLGPATLQSEIPGVYLFKTQQGYIPVTNPGYWPSASQPGIADPRSYQVWLDSFHEGARAHENRNKKVDVRKMRSK